MSSKKTVFSALLILGLFFLASSLLFASAAFYENFSGGIDKEGLPNGWNLKQWFGKVHQIEIVPAGTEKALHLVSRQNSFGLYKDFDFDAKETPILSWRWKVTLLPEGADVRDKSKDDQAAQLYVAFPKFPKMVNTRLVGYIWESGAPKGATVTSQKSSKTRYIVLESGKERLGEWISERRNVYEDYKSLFGEEPPEGGGITLMIDSDDTNSSAESYFGDIRLESNR